MSASAAKNKITVPQIIQAKRREKLAMVTAYDYTMARFVDAAGVDIILVGDSLGMVIQGKKNTLSVTMEQMIYHTRCVAQGARRAHVVLDMPFLSYQASKQDAIKHAGLALKKGKAESIKLEGGVEIAEIVKTLTALGIPVMGHVGLKPQHVHAMGGFKIQGKTPVAAKKILQDAIALQAAGAYGLVLEGIPHVLAKKITKTLKIPTIGIGSGPHCDGQVLVCYDLLGMNPDFTPSFVKQFAKIGPAIKTGVSKFVKEVKSGVFPS